MTREFTSGDVGTWSRTTTDDHDHEVAFAREAVAYLRASGLGSEEIERALCDEVGLAADEAHLLALAG